MGTASCTAQASVTCVACRAGNNRAPIVHLDLRWGTSSDNSECDVRAAGLPVCLAAAQY